MAISGDSLSKHPPAIGKMGPYTVFITPPATPQPPAAAPQPHKVVPPPVQPPPSHFQKLCSAPLSDGSKIDFFWSAVAKVQMAHSSLDDHVARWFGLNQSKYQWALDDYYESKGMGKEGGKAEDMSTKAQSV